MPNVFQPEFDEPRDREGFRARRARTGYQLGTERLGASVWEIDPGEAAYPFHYHFTEEELLVVLEGRPSLRTPSGWRELEAGEIVSFRRGEEGAHQLVNRTAGTVRFLAISTNGDPDLVVYPDSQKLGAAERLPAGGGFRKYFRLESEVDYYDRETPPCPQ
ncbi:MAG TPA: cupin domain-containing protein [Gaiellaceae bacterium]|nr:cupin domain-containing protein [Gaiellaceae bacterium]